jgi:hypothetical protein
MGVLSADYRVICLKYDVCIQAEVLYIGTIMNTIGPHKPSSYPAWQILYIGAIKIPEDLTEVVEQ